MGPKTKRRAGIGNGSHLLLAPPHVPVTNWPGPQLVRQVKHVRLGLGTYWPDGQLRHVEEAGREYLPAWQLLQTDARAALNVPAPQLAQGEALVPSNHTHQLIESKHTLATTHLT